MDFILFRSGSELYWIQVKYLLRKVVEFYLHLSSPYGMDYKDVFMGRKGSF